MPGDIEILQFSKSNISFNIITKELKMFPISDFLELVFKSMESIFIWYDVLATHMSTESYADEVQYKQ